MGCSILIVDDDNDFRAELKEFLSNHKITESSCGEEAIKILKKNKQIDIVILDVMMPGKLGTEVLRDIRKISKMIKVIILTGFSSTAIVIDALKGKADDYIEKPINMFKLKNAVDKLSCGILGCGKDIICRLKKMTRDHVDDNFDLKIAAKQLGVSYKYLSRFFKVKEGMRYSEYRIGLKMEQAKELLHNTRYNIGSISSELGYENVESFIRIFKKYVHMTPAAFRGQRIK